MILYITLCTLLCCAISLRWRRRRTRFPPGPSGLPIIGNMLDMPKEKPWIAFRNLSLQYGSDIIFLNLPGEPTIVLNSAKATTDLLELRSRTYSDKRVAIMDELTGWEWNLGFMPYGQRWRNTRRTFHQYFNRTEVEKYHGTQTREVRALLRRLSSSSGQVDRETVSQMFAAIIFDIVYSTRITSKNDRYIQLAEKAIEGSVLARIPGAFWVEYLPFLRYIPAWVPGSSARKWGDLYKPVVTAARNEPYNAVEQAMDNGSVSSPSIAQSLIQENRDLYCGTPLWKTYDNIARDVTGIAYAASVDTQNAAASSFLLAMGMTPTAQLQAQQELDVVVGSDRLPTFDDLPSLPYIQAIYLEVLRWSPVTPLGLPRRVMDHDEYLGFFIPKGATIFANIWAILHDPELYPDPESFNPDRFIDGGGPAPPKAPSPEIDFGFGRRICPGRHLAKNTLQLMFASILHVFTIEPLPGVKIALNHKTSILAMPESVPCSLKPRSAAVLRLLDPDA